MFRRIILILTIPFILGSHVLHAQDAMTILKKMDNVMLAPKDKQGMVKMILTNKSGKEKVREAIMMQKGQYRLYKYTYPESQAGIATLSLPDGIMWLYLPAFGKARKITLLARSQAFTGTDFSYEDMEAKPYSERYNPELLEENEMGYVLRLTPVTEETEYSKLIVIADKTNFYPVLIEYFDKKGNKIKEATYTYRKIGKYWNAEEVTMVNLKKEHSTKILLTDVKFDQGIPDEEFTVEKLEQEEGENTGDQ